MFTSKCFIRVNKPYIIDNLIELGYVKALFDEEYTESEAYGLIVDQGDIAPLVYGIQEMELMFTYGFIDCDENVNLFLALAALRDDSDYMQWFTDGKKWFQNKQNDIEVIRYGAGNPINFHKATVEEIIEYFKK